METNNQNPVRNYTSMTQELEDLKESFNKGAFSESEYNEKKTQILNDIEEYKYKKTGIKEYIKNKEVNIIKITINTIASFFAILGLLFTILPMESFGLAASVISIALSVISFILFKDPKKKPFSKYLIIVALVISLVAVGKLILIKDKVVKDKQFEKIKVETKKQDIKDLEGLE